MCCVSIFVCFLHYSVDIYSSVVISLLGLSIIIIYLTNFLEICTWHCTYTTLALHFSPFNSSKFHLPNSWYLLWLLLLHVYVSMGTYICTYIHICIYGLLSPLNFTCICMCLGMTTLYCLPGGDWFFLS